MYYLKSRFYDAEICRFINADDAITGDSKKLLGYNLYVYCFNNPVNMSDLTGNWPKLGSSLGAIGVALKVVANHIKNSRNRKKIRAEIQESYTVQLATEEINNTLEKYSKETSTQCTATFYEGKGVEIKNSYMVTSRYDRQKVSMIIERTIDECGNKVTQRSAENMCAEWVFHNMVHDATFYLREHPKVEGPYDSSISAFIDYGQDGRTEVVYITKILELAGVQ